MDDDSSSDGNSHRGSIGADHGPEVQCSVWAVQDAFVLREIRGLFWYACSCEVLAATQVILTMGYELKFSILGSVVDGLVVKGKMPKLLDRVLTGLDYHATTGNLIGQDFTPAA